MRKACASAHVRFLFFVFSGGSRTKRQDNITKRANTEQQKVNTPRLMIITRFLFVTMTVPAVLTGRPEPQWRDSDAIKVNKDPSLKRVLLSNSSPRVIMTKNAILHFGPNSEDWSNLINSLNSTSDVQRDPRRGFEATESGS
ncbi:uncharacterized protein LOC119589462 [Penaeus monodon]|uniref:uncharacterized protein LOC119589462 n=1 Tax=Penaeus monodon TaxID=6687 RepID=UPI0018A7764B|nr:uncharacterized protein LOC119589462 [Penaeus monodon]